MKPQPKFLIVAIAAIGAALLLVSAPMVAKLSPKYVLQDLGLTLLEAACAIALLVGSPLFAGLRKPALLRTPATVWKVFFIGVAAAVLTNLAQIASLLLHRSRGERSAWADSPTVALSVPLAELAKAFIFLLVFVAVYSGLAAARFQGGSPVLAAFHRQTCPDTFWILVFGVPLAASLLWVAGTLLAAEFLFLIPALVWVAFFGLLFAAKRRHLVKRQR